MSATATRHDVAVARLDVAAYTIPTDGPGGWEADGTLAWDATTCVVVQAHAGDAVGLGYTYGPAAAARFVQDELSGVVEGVDALRPRQAWAAMQHACRNAGTAGAGAMAISAVDTALWDLAARLLEVPLVTLLGQVHDAAAVYGSGGFCNLPDDRLAGQLSGWAEDGIRRVKMKVGREPAGDLHRLAVARGAVGEDVELFVDANGAYAPAQALTWAQRFADAGVTWLEEPVSSDDVVGLAQVRRARPPGLAIAAGEYAWDLFALARMLDHAAVDVLQPDVTRCGGFTTFLRADALCRARNLVLSAHCAPALSAHAVCACETAVHLEYFHDHVRAESLLFDGVLGPQAGGRLEPDLSRPGHGLTLRPDAERFAA